MAKTIPKFLSVQQAFSVTRVSAAKGCSEPMARTRSPDGHRKSPGAWDRILRHRTSIFRK